MNYIQGCNQMMDIIAVDKITFHPLSSHCGYCKRHWSPFVTQSASKVCCTSFFFFFYGHYNPLWVLAFSVILFHSALSLHCFLHRLIPIICISSSISTILLFLGLPLNFLPIGFHSNILLGVLLSSICITWPSQAILLLFINLTMSAFSISS